jgi:ferredoxin
METVIYYFTGTGNTLAAAEYFSEAFNEKVRLISIPKALKKKEFPVSAKTGIFYPVYAGGLPSMVKNFIDKLPVTGKIYIFSACTCGCFSGASTAIMNELLRAKGAELSAATVLKMPDNYLPFGNPPLEKKQSELFDKARKKMRKFAEITGKKGNFMPFSQKLPLVWLFKFINKKFIDSFSTMASNCFYADENCDGCGLCAEICPAENIKIIRGLPEWGSSCEQCFACVHWCPLEAAQYRNRSEKKRRYHHPDIKAERLILKR